MKSVTLPPLWTLKFYSTATYAHGKTSESVETHHYEALSFMVKRVLLSWNQRAQLAGTFGGATYSYRMEVLRRDAGEAWDFSQEVEALYSHFKPRDKALAARLTQDLTTLLSQKLP